VVEVVQQLKPLAPHQLPVSEAAVVAEGPLPMAHHPWHVQDHAAGGHDPHAHRFLAACRLIQRRKALSTKHGANVCPPSQEGATGNKGP